MINCDLASFYYIIIGMTKKDILFVFGTRPEVIKLAPVILELKKYPDDYNVIICNTEQQKELSNQTLSYFGLEADINLDCMRKDQTLAGVQSRILTSLEKIFEEREIDATIVQGDTITVLTGALVSFYHKVPVFHVEAGLRSYDIYEPFPEEIMRQMTSRVTQLHFSPTEANKKALLKEDIDEEKISVVGNTVIDALFCMTDGTMNKAKEGFSFKIDSEKTVLITVHRRENHGARLDIILQSISELVTKYPDHSFVLPVHPNPNVKDKVYEKLGNFDNVHLLKPLDYPYLVYLMKNAKLILTDSGGIQEESPSFGCPTLVMRYETERQEGIDAGVSVLVGADYEKIITESEKILKYDKSETRLKVQNPYGDGNSALRIERLIREYFVI